MLQFHEIKFTKVFKQPVIFLMACATAFGPNHVPTGFWSEVTMDNWWTPYKAERSSAKSGSKSKYCGDASEGFHRKSRPIYKK